MKISFIPFIREEHFPSIDIITLGDKKKKEKRINYTGNLDERKISLNVPINRWKYRIFESRIDSGIFGFDKKKSRECLNREIELNCRGDNINIP